MDSGVKRRFVRLGGLVSEADFTLRAVGNPNFTKPSAFKTRVLRAAFERNTALNVHWPASLSCGKVTVIDLDIDWAASNLADPTRVTTPDGLTKFSSM